MIGNFVVPEDALYAIYDVDENFLIYDYRYITKNDNTRDILVIGDSEYFQDSDDCMLIEVEKKVMPVSYIDLYQIELEDYISDEENERKNEDERNNDNEAEEPE
jgi:glucosamine 6-phosphate synthetase-like amidotransferase/phosphosugar isomerase protein